MSVEYCVVCGSANIGEKTLNGVEYCRCGDCGTVYDYTIIKDDQPKIKKIEVFLENLCYFCLLDYLNKYYPNERFSTRKQMIEFLKNKEAE